MTKILIISTFILVTMLAGGNAQTHSDGTLRDCIGSGSNTCERWGHCAWDDGRGVCFNYCPAITDPESCRQLPGCSLVERSNRCDFDSAPPTPLPKPTPPPKPTPEPLRDCDELNDTHCGNHDHCLLGPQGCFNDCPNIDDPIECQNLSGCALVNRSNRCGFAGWSSQNMLLIQSDESDENKSSSLRGFLRPSPKPN